MRKSRDDINNHAVLGSTSVFFNLSNTKKATSFKDWNDWYPVDLNHPEGYVVHNSIGLLDGSEPNGALYNMLSYNSPNKLDTFPTMYKGSPVDYFYIIHRTNSIYHELLALSENKRSLDAWARQGVVYYDPQAFGGLENCNLTGIEKSGKNLADSSIKSPLAFKLPTEKNSYFISPLVCAVRFNVPRTTSDLASFAPPLASVQTISNISTLADEPLNFAVMSVTLNDSKDKWGTQVVYALNIYMSDRITQKVRSIGQQFCPDGVQVPFKCERDSVTGTYVITFIHPDTNTKLYLSSSEEYWMRKIDGSVVANGRQIKNLYGFGCTRHNLQGVVCDDKDSSGLRITSLDPLKTQDKLVSICDPSAKVTAGSSSQYVFSSKSCLPLHKSIEIRSIPIEIYANNVFVAPKGADMSKNENIFASMALDVGGINYGVWRVSNDTSTYVANVPSTAQLKDIKIRFQNDGKDKYGFDRNLVVKGIKFNGISYNTSTPTVYSVGSWSTSLNKCTSGFTGASFLACNGYFTFDAK